MKIFLIVVFLIATVVLLVKNIQLKKELKESLAINLELIENNWSTIKQAEQDSEEYAQACEELEELHSEEIIQLREEYSKEIQRLKNLLDENSIIS